MVPPATPTPTRRREGVWRDPHHNSSAPYPYEYEAMSPNPFGNNRPPPPVPYHYDSQGPPPRGPPGPPRTEYWHSPSPYSNEEQRPPPPVTYRGGGGPYWTPSPYDGYRGAPPRPGSLRGPPHGNAPHPSQHQHLTPSRRSYVGEEQARLEQRVPQPSLGDRHMFYHNHQRKDFNPPAPAPATASVQVSATRGVQVAISASADSEEAPQTDTKNRSTNVNTISPKKDGGLDNDDDAIMDDDSDSKKAKKDKGDPLSVLADVSAGMGGKNKGSKQETGEAQAAAPKGSDSSDSNISGSASYHPSGNDGGNRPPLPMPAPTSPLQRRLKPSPITPSQTPQVNNRNKRTLSARNHQPITPSRSHDTASTAEGVPQSLQPSWEVPSLPHGGSSGSGNGELYSSHPEYNGALQQSGGSYNSPSRRNRPGLHYGTVGEFGPAFPTETPVLVERGSFDSHGDASYRGGAPPYPPSTPTSSRGGAYFYDDHPPPPPGYGSSGAGGGGPYWDSGQPPYSPTYPPPNRGGGGWNHSYPPTTHSDSFYGPPMQHGPPADYSYPPPPPHYGAPEDHDVAMYGGNPPPHPSYHHRGGPPPPLPGPHHPVMSMHAPHMGGPPPPYPYGHPPRMEEKTILRKKFSWKHYPELERYLIANRDEYLKHSNMNYTAEQKQYNNWLTERLLEVASQHNYMFDPDEFNFVAIRDRIRCYYKSYVQTARKRGLKLPEKKNLKSKVPVSTEPKKE